MNPYKAPDEEPWSSDSSDENKPVDAETHNVVDGLGTFIVLAVTVAANAYLLSHVSRGTGFVKLCTVFAGVPLVNLVILSVFCFLSFLLKIKAHGATFKYFKRSSIAAPLMAMVVDCFVIISRIF